MNKTFIIVLVIAVAILAWWFLAAPTTEAPAPTGGAPAAASPESASALLGELGDITIDSLDADFGSIDAELQNL